MSDSPSKENKTVGSQPNKPDSAATGANDGAEKPTLHVSNAGPRRIPFFLMVLLGVAAIAVVMFAAMVVSGYLGDSKSQLANANVPKDDPKTSIKSDDLPISILPPEPEGVTIIPKQPELGAIGATAGIAPIAKGADIATGYAMDLGSGLSFIDLSRRFADISFTNGVDNFNRLEPRAILRETADGLEARLLVGPFETEQAAIEACSVLILKNGIVCAPVLFDGELIARE